MKIIKLLPLLLLIGLISSSCLQHKHKITVLEDGTVEYEYTASGDSADLYDGLTVLPEGIPWEIEVYSQLDTTEGRNDTVYYYKARAKFPKGSKLPGGFGLENPEFAQISLAHPLKVKCQELFFLTNYVFEFSFNNRNSKKLYGDLWDYVPEECRKLETGDSLSEAEKADLEGKYIIGARKWYLQMLQNRFHRSLIEAMKKNPKVQVDTANIERAFTTLDEYLLKKFVEIEKLETFDGRYVWKEVFTEGYNLLEEQLNFLGDTTFFVDMRTIGEILSKEYDVTEDLSDEMITVELKLPGVSKSNNADTVMQNLVWEINGDDIRDSTVVLSAMSTVYRKDRLIVGGIILAGLTIFVLWSALKTKAKNA